MRRWSTAGVVQRAPLRLVVIAVSLLVPVATVASSSASGDDGQLCLGQPATIAGTGGNDLLNGTPSNDVIAAGEGNDRVNGRGGDDVLCGGGGNDLIDAGGGQGDLIDGGTGDDVLTGGLGIDILDGGPGDDVISGGAGRDTATYARAPVGVKVDLGAQQATGFGADRLSGVESVIGSRFADVLVGDGGRNRLASLAGADRLRGASGDDLLDGGAGNDRLDGGAGTDLCLKGETSVRCP